MKPRTKALGLWHDKSGEHAPAPQRMAIGHHLIVRARRTSRPRDRRASPQSRKAWPQSATAAGNFAAIIAPATRRRCSSAVAHRTMQSTTDAADSAPQAPRPDVRNLVSRIARSRTLEFRLPCTLFVDRVQESDKPRGLPVCTSEARKMVKWLARAMISSP